jgi:hypothetical protein
MARLKLVVMVALAQLHQLLGLVLHMLVAAAVRLITLRVQVAQVALVAVVTGGSSTRKQ